MTLQHLADSLTHEAADVLGVADTDRHQPAVTLLAWQAARTRAATGCSRRAAVRHVVAARPVRAA